MKFAPDEGLYRGRRLLVRRGVSTGFGPHARLETEPFAFRHTTYGISLEHVPAWQAKVALGTLLSSLGRYWLFMVSGSWGTWQDEVRSEELLDLPLRLVSYAESATRRIVAAVEALPRAADLQADLFVRDRARERNVYAILAGLDDAVAELFELMPSERELIFDFWASQRGNATAPVETLVREHGTARDLEQCESGRLERYLQVFLDAWNPRIGSRGELGWRVWRDQRARVIAIVFETQEHGQGSSSRVKDRHHALWSSELERLGITLRDRRGKALLAHGIVRAVSDTAVVVVKVDEQRMWTATAAREDAEATIAQVMALEPA